MSLSQLTKQPHPNMPKINLNQIKIKIMSHNQHPLKMIILYYLGN